MAVGKFCFTTDTMNTKRLYHGVLFGLVLCSLPLVCAYPRQVDSAAIERAIYEDVKLPNGTVLKNPYKKEKQKILNSVYYEPGAAPGSVKAIRPVSNLSAIAAPALKNIWPVMGGATAGGEPLFGKDARSKQAASAAASQEKPRSKNWFEKLLDAGKRLISGIVDAIGRFLKKAASAIKTALKAIGDWLSLARDTISGLTNNGLNPFTIIAKAKEDMAYGKQGKPMPRKLNAEEKELLSGYFGKSLDTYAINLRQGRPILWDRNAMAYGNDVTYKNTSLPLRDENGLAYEGSVLVHEAMHVWQQQNRVSDGGASHTCQETQIANGGNPNICYDWTGPASQGVKFSGLNTEQQAQLIQDYVDDQERVKLGLPRLLDADQTKYGRDALALVRSGKVK